MCACSSAYFFRPDVFTVQRFFAFCLVAVMGRFVPLPGTAFFCGRTSTLAEEVEEVEDEEEEELLPSSKVAELSLLLDESLSAEDLNSTELASSSGFQSRSERPREASQKDALSLSTAFATFKVILGFITMGIFFGSPPFFLIVLPDYNPFRQINGVGWHGWMAPSQVTFDVQNPRGGTAPGNRTFTGHVFLFAPFLSVYFFFDPCRGLKQFCNHQSQTHTYLAPCETTHSPCKASTRLRRLNVPDVPQVQVRDQQVTNCFSPLHGSTNQVYGHKASS